MEPGDKLNCKRTRHPSYHAKLSRVYAGWTWSLNMIGPVTGVVRRQCLTSADKRQGNGEIGVALLLLKINCHGSLILCHGSKHWKGSPLTGLSPTQVLKAQHWGRPPKTGIVRSSVLQL